MGLTLNTNSLTVASSGGGSAASELSTSDVTTLIKSNTPYQHIATLTADSSSFLEYTSLPSEYRTFRIIYDALRGNVNQYLRIRLYFDGSEHTSNNYRYGGSEKSTTSTSNYDTTSSYWGIVYNYEMGVGHPIVGFTEFTGNDGLTRPQMYSNTAWRYSSSTRSSRIGGYIDDGSLNMVTGFKLYPSSGNFSRGSIKIYGLVKNES